MDEIFPVQKSTLSTSAIQNFVKQHYGFVEPIGCRLYRQTSNDLYLIRTNTKLYVFRVWASHSSNQVVLEEILRIQALLAKQNLQIAKPIQLPLGHYVEEINAPEGKRCAALLSFVTGKAVGRNIALEQSYKIGQFTAKLHLASKSVEKSNILPTYDVDLMVLKPIKTIERLETITSEQIKQLKIISTTLSKRLKKLETSESNFGLCHGDIHGMNLIFDGSELSVIDFDWLSYSWYAWDLAVFIWWIRGVEKEVEVKENFLSGYRSLYLHADDVIKHFPVFIPIRHLLLTSQIIANFERGMNVGQWVDIAFLNKRLAFIQTWIEDNQLHNQNL